MMCFWTVVISATWSSPGCRNFPRLGHEVYSREFNLVPGGALNCAVALRRLGLRTIWPCRFGSDPFSRMAKQAALAEGLDGKYFHGFRAALYADNRLLLI